MISMYRVIEVLSNNYCVFKLIFIKHANIYVIFI